MPEDRRTARQIADHERATETARTVARQCLNHWRHLGWITTTRIDHSFQNMEEDIAHIYQTAYYAGEIATLERVLGDKV